MSSALTSIDVTSDVTTWSEWTEVTEVTSEAERWRELREKAEPLLIVARRTTPFITGAIAVSYYSEQMEAKLSLTDVSVLALFSQRMRNVTSTSAYYTT